LEPTVQTDQAKNPARKLVSRADLVIISLAYFASQVFFWLSGGWFFADHIGVLGHFLDPELLQNRLAESLWYMHVQPPLFNLLTGISLKLFPNDYATAFSVVFFLLGLGLAWTMYWLMRAMGVYRKLGLAVTILYVFGPADMIYRNWYFYTYPVMALLVFAAALLFKYLLTNRRVWGCFFFAVLFVIVMTRSLYHPTWFAIIAAGMLIILKDQRRRLMAMVLAPALIILLWLGKNHYLFGTFSMSTCLGFSFNHVTTQLLTVEERDNLIMEGKVSSLARILPVPKIEKCYDYLTEVNVQQHPAEALKQINKSTGSRNWNHIYYIPISQRYLQDCIAVIRYCPAAYLRGIQRSILVYFYPIRPDFHPHWIAAYPYYHAWTILGGSIDMPFEPIPVYQSDLSVVASSVCWMIVILYILVPAIFICDWIKKRGFANWDRVRLITLGFIGFNIAYVTAVGILLDCGENNRFRAEIVPLTVIVAAVTLQRLLDGRRRAGVIVTHEDTKRLKRP